LEYEEEMRELRYVGEKIEIELTPAWEQIHSVFKQYKHEDELSSSFIANVINKSQSNISTTLKRMKKKGIVVNGTKRGYYKLARLPEKKD